MGFRPNTYATVWSIEPKFDNLTKARISISRKNKQTGLYEPDFTGFVDFVGTAAAKKALDLKEKDRIKIGDIDVTNRYDKEKGVEYTNYKVFSFEMADGAEKTQEPKPAVDDGEPESGGKRLPF